MVIIVPVINVKTQEKFKERIRQVNEFKGTLQIDIADGKFTAWKNWNSPQELKNIKKDSHLFELHLMVYNPEVVLPLWLETKPQRIIVHLEAIKNFDYLYSSCQKKIVELGLAINPETNTEKLLPYLNLKKINFVLVLGVSPGPSGQKFHWYVLDKISWLRKKYPKLVIEIDGGVNQEIALTAVKAGANVLAIGSAIFDSENPLKQIQYFQKLVVSDSIN